MDVKYDDLVGKVVLVTGASRGIGRVIAEEFVRQGSYLFLTGRNEERVSGVVANFKDAYNGAGISWAVADVSDSEKAKVVVDEVVKKYGRLDVLVNNAGITRDGLIMKMKDKDWDDVIAVNLRGAFNYCKYAAVHLMRSNGNIVNVSSVVGLVGNPGQANYAASKAGLIGLTKSLSRELGRKVRVNAVAPGYVMTDMTRELTDEMKGKMIERTSMRRAIEPNEVAKVVVSLSSDVYSGVTGAVIPVDGGFN